MLSREELRLQFPSLKQGRAYLDNAAGGLIPQQSIEAITQHLTRYGATNGMVAHEPGREILALKQKVREATALLMNAKPADIAIGPSATALVFRLSVAFSRLWKPGDEVIVSGLEHEANASPWRELEQVGLKIRVWHARKPDMRLELDDLRQLLNERTRLVAFPAASNTLGVTPDIQAITALAREAGAWTIVDAVHATPHFLPDVQAWQSDFVMMSPYKAFGPHLGVLWIKPEHREQLVWPKLSFVPQGDVVGIEHGTAQYELWAGWYATLHYLCSIGGNTTLSREALVKSFQHIENLERPIAQQLLEGLLGFEQITVYGPQTMQGRVGTVAFRVGGQQPQATANALSEQGVDVSSGLFCAIQPMKDLDVHPEGIVRASIAHYTNEQEIARLLNGLKNLV